jgi:hypothetical protein
VIPLLRHAAPKYRFSRCAASGRNKPAPARTPDVADPLWTTPTARTPASAIAVVKHQKTETSCGSTQFFGAKKVTTLGWVLYISAIANLLVSGLLMFFLIGFVTIFLSPVLAIVGFYGCRKHVNTCAKCKRDF